jgi:undecaprenyl-diphosphatase
LHAIGRLDAALLLTINHGLARLHLDAPMLLLSRIGTGGAVWFALFLLVFIFGGRTGRRVAITGWVALALALFVSDGLLKGLIQRARPFDPTQLGAAVRVVGARASGFSLPSGHAAAAFAAASLLRRLGSPWGAISWTLAILIGLSRVYVGAHFPGDVLAGVLVGLFAGWLAVRILGDPLVRRHRARPARRA